MQDSMVCGKTSSAGYINRFDFGFARAFGSKRHGFGGGGVG